MSAGDDGDVCGQAPVECDRSGHDGQGSTAGLCESDGQQVLVPRDRLLGHSSVPSQLGLDPDRFPHETQRSQCPQRRSIADGVIGRTTTSHGNGDDSRDSFGDGCRFESDAWIAICGQLDRSVVSGSIDLQPDQSGADPWQIQLRG